MSSTTPLPAHSFSLRDIVADVAQARKEADPALLVEHVLAAIDPSDYEEALTQALYGFVTTFVVTARHTPRSGATTTGRKIGTSRLAGVSAFLASREFSPARGEWIHLSEATAEDLVSMAAKREAMATQYMAKASWYQSIAEALNAHKAPTVGRLPKTVQNALLESRPA